MDALTIIVIAFGLAMDAFAVSISSGIVSTQLRIRNALKMAAFFGIFQACMPLIGWLAGLSLKGFISDIDHWIAFGLLCAIGSKMIYESQAMEADERTGDSLGVYMLFILSIATSIDALMVGLTFAFLKIHVVVPALAIGSITFVLSFLGVFIGKRVGHFFERKMQIAAGLILIAIAVRILIAHLR